VGQLVHTLPEGEEVRGVTLLAGEFYLLRDKYRDQVEVYDVTTFRLQRRLTVPNAHRFTDMTSCEHNRCVYIADCNLQCVHRLDVQGAFTQWDVNNTPLGLSVNAAHNLLVTCSCYNNLIGMIKEFSSHGGLLRQLALPVVDIIKLWHAIQTRSGQFIVCHGASDDLVRRVCMMSADCRHIVHSHGLQPGIHTDQCNVRAHLAFDDNESVFVADRCSRRVTLLSPTLEYVCQVVSRDQLKGEPWYLYLDTQQRLLYVAGNEGEEGEWRGHAAVFSV